MNLLARPRIHCIAVALLLMAASATGPSALAATQTSAPGARTLAGLGRQIKAVIAQPRFAAARRGIAVVSLDTGRTLYAHHPDRLLQPASTAKLFTAALSLATLGADYRIPTRLLARGAIRHGSLAGPLILYGMGDPTLGTESSADWADQLAAQLQARGVRRVDGDLIADASYFTTPPFGPGWEAGDLLAAFAAPPSALSVDENAVTLTITPNRRPGLPALLDFKPATAEPLLRSHLVTAAAKAPSDVNLYRAPGHQVLYAFGSIPADSPPQHFKLAVADPALLAGRQLELALARRGIRLVGQVRTLHWPQDDTSLRDGTHVVAKIFSPPLMEVLHRGLKRSQNLYLQNLFLSVGAHLPAAQQAGMSPGFHDSGSRGSHALDALLKKIGIPPTDVLISEGSGLSRRDLVTPDALVRLLSYLATQPYAVSLRDALPIAGVDGTLAAHMRGTRAENNVHAKTGSMTYVHCLAGYVTSAGGERLAFAIMLNNYHRPEGAPRTSRDVDAIAVLLANFRGRH